MQFGNNFNSTVFYYIFIIFLVYVIILTEILYILSTHRFHLNTYILNKFKSYIFL